MRKSVEVKITDRQKLVLESLSRGKSTPQQLVERCRIVLMSEAGASNEEQASKLNVDRQRVRRWRHRWVRASAMLAAAEAANAKDKDLEKLITGVLLDNARSGAPAKFSAEEVASIISLACEPPSESGLPISHWTPAELAREAISRGIVKSISVRQVDRFLAKRTCDRIRASTGSHRRISGRAQNSTKPTLNKFAIPTRKLLHSQPKVHTS